MRVETPTTPIGRLVLDSVLVARPHDYLNSQTTLGGGDRLRGYPSGEFIGRSAFAANFEFRSRPLEILTLQTAACAFFDVGDAFDEWNQIVVKRGIGAGLRMSLPQLNRAVFRLDWGFPLVLTPDVRSSWPGNFVVTFGQAFGLGGTSP
jgi:hemolysin activation/secretion protein